MNPLQELRDVDAPGTALTAEDLVRIGRAGVRRRRNAIAGAAAALVIVVTVGVAAFAGVRSPVPDDRPAQPGRAPSASAPAAPACRAEPLPRPGGGTTLAPVIDDSGRWAAAAFVGDQGVAIWHDGVLVKVERAYQVTEVAGVSSTGAVAVTAILQHGERRAMTIAADYAVTLTVPPGLGAGASTEARGINAGGDVVGVIGDADAGIKGAVLWRKRDPGHPVLLSAPAGQVSAGLAVGADGTVGGYVDDQLISRVPYLWRPDGTPVPLRLMGGDAGGSVDAIAGDWAVDFGNAVGWRLDEPGNPAPRRFALGPAYGKALAADGTVAGGDEDSAYVVRSGVVVPLAVPDDVSRFAVGGISGDARVVGGLEWPRRRPPGGAPLRWICGG